MRKVGSGEEARAIRDHGGSQGRVTGRVGGGRQRKRRAVTRRHTTKDRVIVGNRAGRVGAAEKKNEQEEVRRVMR